MLILKENMVIASLVGVTGLIGLLLTLPSVSADTEQSDGISISIASACSMSSSGTSSHSAPVDNGTYEDEIGETTINIMCNDGDGFSIYAIGYTNDTYGNTVLKSSLGDTSNIATGTATSGNTSNWAMKLEAGTGTYAPTIETGFGAYHAVPSTYTKVASRSSSTDAINGSTLTTTYAVFMNETQPAGTYTGKVKYTLVHPASHSAPEPPQGLCTDADTCMQQQTSASLAQKLPNVGSTTTLYDSRDNQAYTVAKLADNKYWMVENLNIAGGTALSADNTDVTSEYISGFTGSADENTSPRLVKSGNTITLPASDTAGFGDNSSAFVYNSDNKTNCGASGQNTPCYSYYSWIAATLGGMQSDGSTAQTTGGYNAAASICPKGWRLPTSTTSNASPTTSPNWKTGDWYALATAYEANLESNYYDSSAATGANFYNNAGPVANSAPNFLLAGNYNNGSFDNGGSSGRYWSATSYSKTYAYFLHFNSSSVNSASGSNRRLGNSVRCVFRGQ